MKSVKHVYVALSGGVDSAVAAVRLLEAGYRVTAIFMQTWHDPHARTVADSELEQAEVAASTAKKIGVPFICLDVREKFYRVVIRSFIEQYLSGLTPNPCLFCNPQIKWGLLQEYALDQGADYFATGHYARLKPTTNGKVELFRGFDRGKDQSYVLAMLSQHQLSRSLLPLGDLTKADVRRLAGALNLSVAGQKESQDLCFLRNEDYRAFLQRHAPEAAAPGEIVNLAGEVLGEHQGLAFYTIGQRRGIRIAASEPYFVIDKDAQTNRLIVGYAKDAGNKHLQTARSNWISGLPPEEGGQYQVMIRYRANPVSAKLKEASMDEFRLEFNQPLRGITPGQFAVLYQGEVCLGGGIIKRTW